MKIELHMIQNFAPSCLNRDDTNTPKDCEFGGVRRARISSQCIKRAIRSYFMSERLVDPGHLACRTKRLQDRIAGDLVRDHGKEHDEARAAATAAIRGLGLRLEDDGKTQYLLYLGETEVTAVVKTCVDHWDDLKTVAADLAKLDEEEAQQSQKGKKGKGKKKTVKDLLPKDLADALKQLFDGHQAADLALFGRMLADMPERNIDAACQVAHAISTNRVSMEMDFYTAVDDLRPEDTSGADMMGLIGYNSACFYRYAMIDFDQLLAEDNLDGDRDLADKTVRAFMQGSVRALPTGKQNTFAAHNPPSLVLAVVRSGGAPCSLANGFVKPVRPRPDRDQDLIKASLDALVKHWNDLIRVYGKDGIVLSKFVALDSSELSNGKPEGWEDAGNVDALIEAVMAVLKEGGR